MTSDIQPVRSFRRVACMGAVLGLICISASPLSAYELSDNAAYCYGLFQKLSGGVTEIKAPDQSTARTLYSRQGPKDSTDERTFDEWSAIGRNDANNLTGNALSKKSMACALLFAK